ncbi:MAG: ADP-forming succinate--CoA ligase subunit beta [Candidatus Omnitrophica bacterium]|nr:ADP-forming succinate--CoA ligase subunit beta [Candidatus Omnitrophota bacterium]
MKLHEYQAKRLFATFGIPVPRGIVATSPAQAGTAYMRLKRLCRASGRFAPPHERVASRPSHRQSGVGFACNVKAQIHAGGRGKAGGVLLASDVKEARAQAARLLGTRLVTHQTGPDGLPVRRVLLDERITVKRELYLAMTIDRSTARPMVLASREGGVEIETIAKDRPQAIVREPVDPAVGWLPFQARRLHVALGLPEPMSRAFAELMNVVSACLTACDASLVEINPLVETSDGRLLALDAKVVLDDNGLFRHPRLARLRDNSQEHPLECRASRVGVSYVGLDGTIGCLVNGAGLAMATNDIIQLYGGSPANFLDVGGGANVEQVTRAFRILLADRRVRAILVNIFGGIMRCDWVAQGLLNATKTLKIRVPLVVRLAGTNVEEGRRLLAESGLSIVTARDVAEAAQQVVALAEQQHTRIVG